ncbi:MAG: pectinesterase family protein [Cellvibrio sp.]
MKRIILVFSLFFLVSSCSFNSGKNDPAKNYDAVVSQTKTTSSTPVYTTVQAAIDAAPEQSSKPFRIYIANGTYFEKLVITKSNLQILGEDSQKTRLVFNDYAGKATEPGKTLGTPATATLTVRAKDISIKNLTIENSFDFLSNDARTNEDPARVSGAQAVALFIDIPSDKVLVRNVSLLGYQDTLFVNSGRSWFDKVFIAGNVDYIFGNGNAVFTESEIKTVARGKANTPHGFVTAPSTQITSEYGLTFLNCRLTRDASVPDNSVPLGRPWHPTTTFSDGRYADPNAIGKSVFINTWMDAHITTDGWYSMSGTQKEGGRKSFLPEDARFFEYKSTGPGAFVNTKHRQLTDEEAKLYTLPIIFGDWQPN